MARASCAVLIVLLALFAAPAAAAVGVEAAAAAGVACQEFTVDFIVLDSEATLASLEDDIRLDLEQLGVNVTRRFLPKEEFNAAMTSGDFNMAFSETWGPPYDPHSYAKSWAAPDEAHFTVHQGLQPPMTKAVLDEKIDAVLTIENGQERQEAWTEILSAVHEQAINLPFSGKRVPAVISKRLSGFVPGHQQFDYPLHTLRVESGSKTVTVAPGGQTGLFVGVGQMDPHTYRPNEFFANNWLYEGLVEYGPDGSIAPSLASSWSVTDNSQGGQDYRFVLRDGVSFHDGSSWNCSVAKLNFDHVLADPLVTAEWHGWYGLPGQISSVACDGTTGELILTTKETYYPLLQELTYIRPLRMLSPAMFVGGLDSDPYTQNSCAIGWGNVTVESDETGDSKTVQCVGIMGASGTGRWKYHETVVQGGEVLEVAFLQNANHWAGSQPGAVEKLRLIRYSDHAAVKTALLDGSLDVVIGSGPLLPADVRFFMTESETSSSHRVYLTESLQNRVIVLNAARPPTDDIRVRKVIIHGVNKAAIIDSELSGLDEPVDALFPKTAPYCDIDLTPSWDYDLEKAQLLNCPAQAALAESSDGGGSTLSTAAIVGITALGVAAAAAVAMTLYMVFRERRGNPLFPPLLEDPTPPIESDSGSSQQMAEIKTAI